MAEILRPDTDKAVLEALSNALVEKTPLEIVGGGTKRAYGGPVTSGATRLDLSALSGITLYEPNELVLGAGAATPMAEIERVLDAADQQLAFEPQDLGFLLGAASEGATLGGVIAAGLSGPRRIKDGSARDHLLGFHAVSGAAEVFKSGGRVVKNVTGFDLSKLMAGSFGTLAVMTDVTIKVVPRPEKTRTVLVFGLDDATAIAAMTVALGSAFEVSAAAHLPEPMAGRSAVGYVSGAGASVTAIRVEGFGPSVASRCNSLKNLLTSFAAVEELHSQNSRQLWQEIRDVRLLDNKDATQVWRLSVPPSDGAGVASRIVRDIEGAEMLFDWGGGLVWVAVPSTPDAHVAHVRGALANVGSGHATLVRAAEDVRRSVPVFHPGSPGLSALGRRVRETFDPEGILNPGRLELKS